MIRSDREEDVGRFDRDLVLSEVVILENSDVVERALNEGLGARFAILFEKVLLEASGVER